jgi:serine/threonine protein kinase
MPAQQIICGPTANQSEERALQRLKSVLSDEWVLLSNLSLITGQDRQPSEIDVIAIGPSGVIVIEVKHWDAAWVRDNPDRAEDEARILKSKTERVGSFLRRELSGLEIYAQQCIVFTRESNQTPPPMLAGAPIWTLKSSKAELGKFTQKIYSPDQVRLIVEAIQPRARLHTDGKLRTVGDYQNMELISPEEDRFHRIFKAQHRRTREKVILHLYDLSDTRDKEPRRLAEREFRVLQELQKCRYVPRTRDSFQDLPGFPGEVCMFSVFDPGAPSLKKRSTDSKWTPEERIQFAIAAADALAEIHGTKNEDDTQIVHRNLSPESILVGPKNRPIFTGFDVARAEFTRTLPPMRIDAQPPEWIAPELAGEDLSKASICSDVYSLCVSLKSALTGDTAVDLLLSKGLVADPGARISAFDLKAEMELLLKPVVAAAPRHNAEPHVPRAEFWCEGTEVLFKGRKLEIIASLGAGGIGRTFKVGELKSNPDEGYYGEFVAKVIFTKDAGEKSLEAYRRARQHSQHPRLATVFEIADEWQQDNVVALLQWVEGEPLSGLRDGLAALAVQEAGLFSIAELCTSWLRDGCHALAALHTAGLVHGDVSPRNIIYSPDGLVLTDYDLVRPSGEEGWTTGAHPFSSPESEENGLHTGSDDVYALAVSLFSIIFDTDTPFRRSNGAQQKSAGLSWPEDARELLGEIVAFLDRATNPDRSQRFKDALEALRWLDLHTATSIPATKEEETTSKDELIPSQVVKTPNLVPWLDQLLSVYPGSPRGNIETRGLDSEFATATYVRTALEDELVADIQSGKLRLLILCGNAGDGKTALLQRIGQTFGAGKVPSDRRVWNHVTTDGMELKANLDGSAAWNERSADELLDEILLPFLDGIPLERKTHLLAINDGRLLQWLDEKQANGKTGKLLESLAAFLSHDDNTELPSHLRFISLNHRSLVGGRSGDGRTRVDFINQLITSLIGGDQAKNKWKPCLSCSAWDRCTAGPMAHRLMDESNVQGSRIRERINEALQAVHQRGNVHITARELRGTLSYILFGVRYCEDLHAVAHTTGGIEASLTRIGDMAFNPDSPFRQGDLLREMTELDPALEAHSNLDRYLLARAPLPHGADERAARSHLASLRRSAFFEWTIDDLKKFAGDNHALGLAGGRYLSDFRSASEGSSVENSNLCKRVVKGISHLEDLPLLAVNRSGKVALRLPTRTQTETKFWVELDLDRFHLEPDLPANLDKAIPRLARQIRLTFTRSDNKEGETLLIGYQLFAVLLQLESGEQLADVRSDDLFANLQIFTQRLAQESSRSLFAWNPKEDEKVFSLRLEARENFQSLAIKSESNF